MFTYQDARAERAAYDAKMEEAARLREVNENPANPAIGKLCRDGKSVFYAFVNGKYTEAKRWQTIAKKLEAAAI